MPRGTSTERLIDKLMLQSVVTFIRQLGRVIRQWDSARSMKELTGARKDCPHVVPRDTPRASSLWAGRIPSNGSKFILLN
eukprot:5889921-Amphidinium_carterae.1